jgi:hypothetical protein
LSQKLQVKIRWGFAMDFAESLPYVFHPSMVYKLNSKRWLAQCPLQSANDRILDCALRPCPDSTSDSSQWIYCGSSCDQCRKTVEKETARISQILQSAKLPYVLKLTQSLASVGTNIVRTEDERQQTAAKIEQYLQAYLPRITEANASLYTTSLILSDFIKAETMALNVRADPSAPLLYLEDQLTTESSSSSLGLGKSPSSAPANS